MLAYALLAVLRARERSIPQPAGMIPLTCNEIGRLLNAHAPNQANDGYRLRWSIWRR